MLNTPINPFAAICAILIIALTGTVFVIHQIQKVDFSEVASYSAQ